MDILRWGLIGAGDISQKRVAPALRDLANCDFVSVSRSRFELAESFAHEFGARKWFADWRELLADDEIDAVYIATPVYLHAEQTIAAANAGKHILCEKPMALNVKECDEMLAACRTNNVKLGIAYYRHLFPVIQRIKAIIASGEIGKVSIAQINAFEYFAPSTDNSRHWLLQKEKSGGGPMKDFGCHRLEVLTNLFGTVNTLKSLVTNAVFERDVEDTAVVLLQFDSGTLASVTVTHASQEAQDTLDIFGTKGSIHIPVLNQGVIKVKIGNNERIENHPPASNVHQPLIAEFTDAVLTNREPKLNGELGRMIEVLEEKIYA